MRYLALLLTLLSFPLLAKTISISTAPWQPYINKENTGSANELLTQLFSQDDMEIDWLTQNYDLAFEQVSKSKKLASFPYFKTAQRVESVLYSNAVFTVNSYLYFNGQYNQNINAKQISEYRIARVAGYSYGEQIDRLLNNAVVFQNEISALNALLNNEVDVLPMTESVMNYLLNTQFEHQKLLIKKVDKVQANASLHLIAAKNAKGRELIETVNKQLDAVDKLESFKLAVEPLKIAPDIAKLITSEGYPAILAQTSLTPDTEYFTLAQGTRVLILQWSDKLVTPSKTDRIYKNMMDVSKVVILNGPLVGKEVFVRNMHLELI